MEIPIDRLNPDVLAKIIEEFVLREGTDYGSIEYTLEQKVQHVMGQIRKGQVKVVFDPETESVSLERSGAI